ncbi:hypothetical protein INR49_021970 [Caranx melampygus]|nr:hypothetical protein INR49_021970 [Caranx melampygus]
MVTVDCARVKKNGIWEALKFDSPPPPAHSLTDVLPFFTFLFNNGVNKQQLHSPARIGLPGLRHLASPCLLEAECGSGNGTVRAQGSACERLARSSRRHSLLSIKFNRS